MTDIDEEVDALVTRSAVYLDVPNDLSSPKRRIVKKSPFLKCKIHFQVQKTASQDSWMKENTDCSDCIKFETRETLPNGLLPNKKELLEYLITLNQDYTGQRVNTNRLCSLDLMLHWIY